MPARSARSTNTVGPSSRLRSREAPSPSIEVPDEGPPTWLRTKVCVIFGDAQSTSVAHRKLAIRLRKLQELCSYNIAYKDEDPPEEYSEEDFNEEVTRCILRLMPVRRGEIVGDRMIRFLVFFLKYATDKDTAMLTDPDESTVFSDMPSNRLINAIFTLLLPLFNAKEKTVRYRSTQIITHIINTVSMIDDEYYFLLRNALFKRTRDREPMVRVQAVLGLGRLLDDDADENDKNSDDGSEEMKENMKKMLNDDPSAEVRRALLLNVSMTKPNLRYLVERSRDVDPVTRRALYSRVLPKLSDFRSLPLKLRDKILRRGLRDRDETVRKAAAKLFRECWIENSAFNPTGDDEIEQEMSNEAQPPSMDGLLELVGRIDVISSGSEEGIAHIAMNKFWEGRPDYREFVMFDEAYWKNLTPQSVFIIRSLNDFCRFNEDKGFENLVDEKFPEVTQFAQYLSEYLNTLVNAVEEHEDSTDSEEATRAGTFIVDQLLHIALTLDYADEIGRRKMFTLLREFLTKVSLPDETMRLVVEVLRLTCGRQSSGEREFCGIVLEAIAEIHDVIDTVKGSDTQRVKDEEMEDANVTGEGEGEEMEPKAENNGEGAEVEVEEGGEEEEESGEEEEGEGDEDEYEEENEYEEDDDEDEGEGQGEGEEREEEYESAQSQLDNQTAKRKKGKTGPSVTAAELGESYVQTPKDPKTLRSLMLNMKCLHVAQCMLENIEGQLQSNPELVTMFHTLIVPAIRSHHSIIREKGIFCLGLCCLHDKELSKENISLFFYCFDKGHEGLQKAAVEILSDVLTTHPFLINYGDVTIENRKPMSIQKAIRRTFFKAMKTYSAPSLQVSAARALCKLLLLNVTKDTDLLKFLLICFFEPDSQEMDDVRQVLSYFLPAYCYSKRENMERLCAIAVGVVHSLVQVSEELEEEENMVSLATVVGMIVELTDARKLVDHTHDAVSYGTEKPKAPNPNGDIHLDLAKDILEKTITRNCPKSERKLLLSALSNLYITENSTASKIQEVYELVVEAVDDKVAPDAPSRNNLRKLQTTLKKFIDKMDNETIQNNEEQERAMQQQIMQQMEREMQIDQERSRVGVIDSEPESEAAPEAEIEESNIESTLEATTQDNDTTNNESTVTAGTTTVDGADDSDAMEID